MRRQPTTSILQNQTAEWSFKSKTTRKNPFDEVELSVRFQDARGEEKLVPAFWAGGRNWRVRFASPMTGKFRFRTLCSDPADSGLHGQEGAFTVQRYTGSNPLYCHGPIRVAADKRHFSHLDGTPFFWLGDTWWMGLCKRMSWPREFQTLTTDRVKKGFSVVQIVAGLYPDMLAFDERGANEAGFPWEKDYARINPAYFDMADRRIQHLVESGLVPCIVGCWGYFLSLMGVEKMKQHWRNLVARYASYPVVWCLAGEATMPYFVSPSPEEDGKFQKKGWTELASYVRKSDPHRRPITIHPVTPEARQTVDDPSLLDFDFFGSGHRDRASFPEAVKRARQAYRTTPVMPIIHGEGCYEGIGEGCRQEVQRLIFWACILNGAAGHTYGADGIWQVNTRSCPFGPSPHGMSWGHTPWKEAYRLPGSHQLGLAKRLLARYPWWNFEPHPEWVEPHWTEELLDLPYTCGRHDIPMAGGIPGKVRIIYQPLGVLLKMVKGIERGAHYDARLINPASGVEQDYAEVTPDAEGNWVPHPPGVPEWFPFPIFQDWLLIMEAT